jgi:hypothetical protein
MLGAMNIHAMLAVASAIVLQPSIAQATEPPIAASVPSAAQAARIAIYDEAVLAMSSGIVKSAMADRVLAEMRELFAAQPQMKALENQSAGALDRFLASLKPVFRDYTARTMTDYHAKLRDLLMQHMTETEVREMARFYASPLGRKVIGIVVEKQELSSTFRALAQEKPITQAAVAADSAVTQRRVVSALTAEETAAMSRLAGQSWLPKVTLLEPRFHALQVEMVNEPMSREEEALLVQAMAVAYKQATASKR